LSNYFTIKPANGVVVNDSVNLMNHLEISLTASQTLDFCRPVQFIANRPDD